MEKIKEMFAIIEDPRHESYVEHELCDILILVMGAVICGVTELGDMMTYFKNNTEFYKEKFKINFIPSKPTISRVLNVINADVVGDIIVKIMCEHTSTIGGILAVDGKAIRGTGKKEKAHSFLQILSVYATESGITLASKAIEYEDKTNEIPVFRDMLDDLNIEGKTITADAMHCQKETCAKIIDKKGNYIFGVKDNQQILHDDIELFFSDSINDSSVTTFEIIERNGGRIEKRICRASDDIDWITNKSEWDGLSSICSITRITTIQGKTTEDTGYYIASLDADAKHLLHVSRSHWKIESMHWALDVIWGEDNNNLQSDNSQKVMNVFRNLAHFAHKKHVALQSPKNRRSVKQNVFHSLLNQDTRLEVMAQLSHL